MDTGKRVLQLANERNLTLGKLAKICGMQYSTLYTAISRGSQLSVDTIERVCAGLGITLAQFFTEPGTDTPSSYSADKELSPEDLTVLREIIDERKGKQ